MVEDEHSLFSERRDELNSEERITSRLLVHQLRERRGVLRLAAKRVRDQLPEVLPGEWRQRDLRHLAAGVLDGVKLLPQRMDGIDFVVAICADQHKVLQIRPGQEILEQVECRRVEPLKIVEEDRKWMCRPREHADKPPKHKLETSLRVLWRKLRDGWLVTDDKLELGNEIGHEPAVRAERLQKGVAPTAQLGVALPEERPNKAVKSLGQRRIRNVALVLVELARGEQAARRHQRLVQLVDDGGLADAGISRHEHEFRGALSHNSVESCSQRLNLALPAVEFLRDQQPVRPIVLAKRKPVDAAI